jgi:hypothetical protein
MRKFQLFLVLITGGLTVYLQVRSIKGTDIFGMDIFQYFPLIILCIITFIYFIKNLKVFKQTSDFKSLLPSGIGLAIILLTLGHALIRFNLDNSKSLFIAENYDIGSDNVFRLDFKSNNHLVGHKIDRFGSTFYWGSYIKRQDTLKLNIHLDFKMGRQAILRNDTLHFIDDTIHFIVFLP